MRTADMSYAPLVLSDLQMELLSGTEMLMDWDCIFMDPCQDIPCNNNLLQADGVKGCKGCETAPNLTCYLIGSITCDTCRVWQYQTSCSDIPELVYTTSYKNVSRLVFYLIKQQRGREISATHRVSLIPFTQFIQL